MKKIKSTVIEEFIYDSEEERNQHVKEMESIGWNCTGQIKQSFRGILSDSSELHWYAKLVKFNH